jgi:hypothetical protein
LDNQALESNLKTLKQGGSGGTIKSELEMQMKIMTIEKERDHLKWD